MTDRDDLIRQAREMLAGVPPGEWVVDPDDRPGMEWNFHICSEGSDDRICFMANFGDDEIGERIAHFIAWARNNMPALIAELEKRNG